MIWVVYVMLLLCLLDGGLLECNCGRLSFSRRSSPDLMGGDGVSPCAEVEESSEGGRGRGGEGEGGGRGGGGGGEGQLRGRGS